MSNSIWKMPDQKPDKNCPIVFRNDIGVIYCALDPKSAFLMRPDHKWAYLHEVIAQADKAERLQKAVDKALHYLDAEYHAYIMVHQKEPELIATVLKEIKQLIKE